MLPIPFIVNRQHRKVIGLKFPQNPLNRLLVTLIIGMGGINNMDEKIGRQRFFKR